MDKEFWLTRWHRAEIGFHQDGLNPSLRRFWPEVAAAPGSQVFVPLCGKSLDMAWLRQQGAFVFGIELSPIAVKAFFHEQGMTPECVSGGRFDKYLAEGYCLACGDFFELRREDVAQVSVVYDRASLVALPPDMRERYAWHLLDILSPGTRILLVAFDYPQAEMKGPPFAVSREEVDRLCGQRADVRSLASEDALAQDPRFRQRGMTRMEENTFLLTLR
jgi:thiopurine S-methyltransferase